MAISKDAKESIKTLVIILGTWFGLAILTFFIMWAVGQSCIDAFYKRLEENRVPNENFYCKIEGGVICIVGITSTGEQNVELIVPSHIDGKEVQILCEYDATSWGKSYCNIVSDKLERFYTPYTLQNIVGYSNDDGCKWISSKMLEAVFYPSIAMFEKDSFSSNTVLQVFPSSPVKSYVTLKTYNLLLSNFPSEIEYKDIRPANVSYLFNYEGSPNDDYYFIDYAKGETLIRNAPAPEREGYRFVGWYKDSACTQAWDFETDTVPATEYDENEKEVYQETKLYAKWEEL